MKVLKTISGVAHYLGSILLMFVFLAVVANVVARLTGNSMLWVEETTGYITIWAVYLGLAYTLYEGKHVKVELIIDKLSPLAKKVFAVINALANVIFSGIICWKAIVLIQLTWQTQAQTQMLRLPIYPFMLALPIGMILFAMVAIGEVVATVVSPEGEWKAETTAELGSDVEL